MLTTIAIILIILWLAGVVTATSMGGLIHILLVIAVIMILVQVIQGRKILQFKVFPFRYRYMESSGIPLQLEKRIYEKEKNYTDVVGFVHFIDNGSTFDADQKHRGDIVDRFRECFKFRSACR